MATHTSFADRFVFKYEWPALRGMTLETGLVMADQSGASAGEGLRSTRSAAFDRIAAVRVMAIGAADLAFHDRMMMGQLKRSLHLRVALEAGRGRFSRIDDRDVASAAGLYVQAARAMTRFAADVLPIRPFGFEPS